jgi:hypothetical protein
MDCLTDSRPVIVDQKGQKYVSDCEELDVCQEKFSCLLYKLIKCLDRVACVKHNVLKA